MAVTLLEGSPFSDGHRQGAVADIDGLASYTTGGQSIAASSLGLALFESVHAGASNDGVHLVYPAPGGKGPRSTIKLIWIVLSTGAEVGSGVNVSSKSVRVRARGL